jgi:hypothetical protein
MLQAQMNIISLHISWQLCETFGASTGISTMVEDEGYAC